MAAAVRKKSSMPRLVGAGHEAVVVVQHRGNDAGGAIGWGGDDATTGRVFLIHRQGEQIDPVHHVQGSAGALGLCNFWNKAGARRCT